MRTTFAETPKTAARPPNRRQLEIALRKMDSSKSIDIIKKTLKDDRSAYNDLVAACDHFKAKDKVRVQCHKSYYESAVTPLDKAIGSINAARVHRDRARSCFAAGRLLKLGPLAVLEARHEEDAAIKWLERAQRTGLSGDDQDLVRLLIRRSTRCFVPPKSALRDHLAALRVTAYALKRGHFYDGHLIALKRRSNSAEVDSFIRRTIRPLVQNYQSACDSTRFFRHCQHMALADAKSLLGLS